MEHHLQNQLRGGEGGMGWGSTQKNPHKQTNQPTNPQTKKIKTPQKKPQHQNTHVRWKFNMTPGS